MVDGFSIVQTVLFQGQVNNCGALFEKIVKPTHTIKMKGQM